MTGLFPTTLVGSYPQPKWLIALDEPQVPRVPSDLWLVDSTHLEEAKKDAVRLALADQTAAGIDIVSDGESQRESYSNLFANSLTGIDREPGTALPRSGVGTMLVPRVIGPLGRRRPIEPDEVLFLRTLTDRPIMVTLPGPFTLSQQAENSYYATDAEMAMAYADVVNQEAQDLFSAGAAVVQLDEPFMAARPDKAREFGLEAFEKALTGLTGTTAVHLCFGYAALAPDRPLAYPFLEELEATSVNRISIETAQSSLDCSVLSRLPSKTIILGVLDLSSPDAETPATIVQRVERALKYVSPDRLVLAPDCGMKFLPRTLARQKLSAMVTAARELRLRYGE